jgi:acyl carrier protein
MGEIIKILNEIKPEFDFSKEQDFIDNGLLDSFDIVSLVSKLDSTYSISIEGTEIIPDNFNNLKNIQNLLNKYKVISNMSVASKS